MLHGLMGADTSAGRLKEALDASSERIRGIAHRVANATNASGQSFADTLDGAAGRDPATADGEPVDLEAEMTALANEQIRNEASSDLLRRIYRQLHTSVRGV
jgi:flagellar basal body rod protein FlgB